MFYEVLDRRTDKGCIGLSTSATATVWDYWGIVLVEGFHLSYPYVFEWDGEWYMLPESYQAGAVTLYRSRSFPTVWERAAVLVDAPYLVDPSLLRHDGTWWLFAEANPKFRHDRLRLFFADELSGPWTEHPKSPLVDGDRRVARPAGRVIATDQGILRFAQDCSTDYGSGVRALQITTLTPTEYAEHELTSNPILRATGNGWCSGGMHHVDAHHLPGGAWIACVDGWRRSYGWDRRPDAEFETRRGITAPSSTVR